jgi:hypothetical protein
MPVSYEIDRDRGLIRTRCYGPTTLPEVLEHFEVLRAQPDLPERLDGLLDLTDMVGAPERDQLRAIAGGMKGMTSQVTFGAFAIVAPGDLLFGMSRMLGIFAEGLIASTGVFRTLPEAERWLEQQQRARRAP